MKNFRLISSAIIISAFIWQCTDKDVMFDNDITPPSAERFNQLFEDGLRSETAFAHFDSANNNFIYTSSRGTTVKINGSCLRLNGAPVTGTVIMEFVELYDRAKMLVANKPTMGIKTSGEKEMMLSGGEFFVTVKKDGNVLTTTCPVTIETLTSNSGGTVTGMQAFNGAIANNTLTWTPTATWDVITNTQVTPNKYTMSVPGFGWFNCDKFYNYPNPKTTITANVPSGYANASQVFIITKDVPNALGTIGGQYPVGLQCYLLFVTENNGNFMWVTKEQTLTANHTIFFDLKDAQVGKSADYVGHVTLLK
ncbi:hypothetical protein ASG31_13260 [Chryseobacterium sp. Leaf404]|uniref:hypothetical protein n=1 Tax=unclassified Chryseobacterium TaxID=2593645 RepID=UPI0006F2011A|nr:MULTISPECIES: hypothetical protein [unclassified Chryseobacterium]KQT16476.1 hypothetical protein ASG31_13260 [Chryseobacterium sp. Leaf404]